MPARIARSQATRAATLRSVSAGPGKTIHQPRRWLAAVLCLGVALLSAALVTFCFAPRFYLWRGLEIAEDLPASMAEFDRAIPTLAQLDDPWAPVNNAIHRVIAWRLLFPVVWHYLHLPRMWFLAMPQIGCLAALWLVAWLTYERLGRWWPAWVATTLFAALPWFFVSSGWLAHFDSWLVIGLLLVAFVPSRVLLILACLLTPWVNARFVLADSGDATGARNRAGQNRARRMASRVTGYCRRGCRELSVSGDSRHRLDARRPGVDGLRRVALGGSSHDSLDAIRRRAMVGFSHRLARGRGRDCACRAPRGVALGAAFAIVVIASALGGLFIAWDMSRTLMIVSPVFLLGMWLWEEIASGQWRWLLSGVLVANLLAPAHHVLWSVEWRIAWLPAEIERWRNPPPIFAAVEFMHRAAASERRRQIRRRAREFRRGHPRRKELRASLRRTRARALARA